MKIGFVVNDVATEKHTYATTSLALAALKRDHQVYTLGISDFAEESDNHLRALAHAAPKSNYKSHEKYLAEMQNATPEKVEIDDLDVLMLRNDAAEDMGSGAWTQTAGIVFGQLAARRGPLVVNHPATLADAINKMYFQHFPQAVRPKTLISRNIEDIRRFHEENDHHMVIKPLQGSGGAGVFLVRPTDAPNLNQMVESIARDGYIVAQEYLPKASEGDIRLFLMNGRALEVKGKYAAIWRRSTTDDMRSNMHVGGSGEHAEITPEILKVVEIVRPKLIADGMYLVGLDIVGDKLMEINVFSPGGLWHASEYEGVDFSEAVIQDLERKMFYREHYGHTIDNKVLATL